VLLKQRDLYETRSPAHPSVLSLRHGGRLACITDQSTVYASDDSGYTIKLGAYGRTDFARCSSTPRRCSSSAASNPEDVPRRRLDRDAGDDRRLADKGFTADTSALNWKRIEEWNGKELYRWNMENWNRSTTRASRTIRARPVSS